MTRCPNSTRRKGGCSAHSLTALKHLGVETFVVDEDNSLCPEWRMVRVDDVVLLEKPADDRSPKRVDGYQVAERSGDGAAFSIRRG